MIENLLSGALVSTSSRMNLASEIEDLLSGALAKVKSLEQEIAREKSRASGAEQLSLTLLHSVEGDIDESSARSLVKDLMGFLADEEEVEREVVQEEAKRAALVDCWIQLSHGIDDVTSAIDVFKAGACHAIGEEADAQQLTSNLQNGDQLQPHLPSLDPSPTVDTQSNHSANTWASRSTPASLVNPEAGGGSRGVKRHIFVEVLTGPPQKKTRLSTLGASQALNASASGSSPISGSAMHGKNAGNTPSYADKEGRHQRTCHECGQPGRQKGGKVIEKWGPGPDGPGTVCDKCRKRTKRRELAESISTLGLSVPSTAQSLSQAPVSSQSPPVDHGEHETGLLMGLRDDGLPMDDFAEAAAAEEGSPHAHTIDGPFTFERGFMEELREEPPLNAWAAYMISNPPPSGLASRVDHGESDTDSLEEFGNDNQPVDDLAEGAGGASVYGCPSTAKRTTHVRADSDKSDSEVSMSEGSDEEADELIEVGAQENELLEISNRLVAEFYSNRYRRRPFGIYNLGKSGLDIRTIR